MLLLRHPFLVFFVFSLAEAVLLAKVGTQIGWGWTILAIVATAMIGSAMWRQQGLETWRRLNERMARGELPGSELIEGVMLIVGGALLITPGFITDTIGFLLLLPWSRKAAAKWLFDKGVVQNWSQTGMGGGFTGYSQYTRTGPNSRVWVYQRTYTQGTQTETETAEERIQSQDHTEQGSVKSDDDGVIEGEFIPKDRQ